MHVIVNLFVLVLGYTLSLFFPVRRNRRKQNLTIWEAAKG
jgi:hypothetical protein